MSMRLKSTMHDMQLIEKNLHEM